VCLLVVPWVAFARPQDRVDATGLPRTARALFLLGAVATLWLTSSCAQAAIGLFVALTYWRTLLAPREVRWGVGAGAGRRMRWHV
jgi:hypothetical protein